MNTMGKELMAKRIVEAIKHTLKVRKKKPTSVKWKGDPSTENQGPGGSYKWSWRRKRSL